jgi:hypothetical protein
MAPPRPCAFHGYREPAPKRREWAHAATFVAINSPRRARPTFEHARRPRPSSRRAGDGRRLSAKARAIRIAASSGSTGCRSPMPSPARLFSQARESLERALGQWVLERERDLRVAPAVQDASSRATCRFQVPQTLSRRHRDVGLGLAPHRLGVVDDPARQRSRHIGNVTQARSPASGLAPGRPVRGDDRARFGATRRRTRS